MKFWHRYSFPRQQLFIAVAAFCSGGLIVGSIVWLTAQGTIEAPKTLRQSNVDTAISEYKFIDPLIGLKTSNTSSAYNSMQQSVQALIDAEKKAGLTSATIIFRDINASSGFSINPDEKYTPASLLKVPVMMVYYKIAEETPGILNDRITYTGSKDSNAVEDIRSAVTLKRGETYTVEELIEHMIRYSDNNAVDLLTQHLLDTNNLGDYAAVFSDLGIDPRSLKTYSDTVTASQYLLFIRALYNSTYLSREYSEKAMELMSATDFSEGIESGVPNDVSVAQKFGEVRMTDASGNQIGKQLHNCGVIYYPKHPYILCIMTKDSSTDIPSLEHFIASISGTVYKHMQTIY